MDVDATGGVIHISKGRGTAKKPKEKAGKKVNGLRW